MSDPPPPSHSAWKARRNRRRDRQRAALQVEAATHDPNDVAHFQKTARRYFREAIRESLRDRMMAPWNDDGVNGLRVVIDLGMQDLMCDSERRSLVTQLQLSYADPLRLAVDAVEAAAGATEENTKDFGVHDVASNPRADETPMVEDPEPLVDTPRVTQRDRARQEADAALRAFFYPERAQRSASGRTGRDEEEDADERDSEKKKKKKKGAPTRLLFSSLSEDGVMASALANDIGSKRWPVMRTSKRFDEAAFELCCCDGGSSAERRREHPENRKSVSVVVLSPDSRFSFSVSEPIDAARVYVVGGLCDYKRVFGATLRRAEASDVPRVTVSHRRLPIEEIFGSNASVNILTVNQTVEILTRVALNGGDWRAAFTETLPERKLREMRSRG
jgi:hypothetical protein